MVRSWILVSVFAIVLLSLISASVVYVLLPSIVSHQDHETGSFDASEAESFEVSEVETLNAAEDGEGYSYRYVHLFIPVSRVRELVGVRIDRAFAVPCYDNTILIPVRLLPRRFKLTRYVPLNKTILIPDIGDVALTEEDVLVLSTPIPLGTATVGRCPWAEIATKYGYGYRVLLRLDPRTPALVGSRFEELNRELVMAVYFSYNGLSMPVISVLPCDEDVLNITGEALGLRRPKVDYPLRREHEEVVNLWLKNVRERLLEVGIGRNIDSVVEKAFVYGFEKDQPVSGS